MHPLDIFHFCPKCGSNQFNVHSPTSKKCDICGFEYFKNPVIGAAAVVFDNKDRLLCIRRAKNPGKGTLALPGGFVDNGETIEQAAVREAKEETGIDVKLTGLIANIPNTYIYSGMEQYPLDFFFGAEITDLSCMRPQEGEAGEILFIPREQINPKDFGMLSTQIFLKNLLKK